MNIKLAFDLNSADLLVKALVAYGNQTHVLASGINNEIQAQLSAIQQVAEASAEPSANPIELE